MVILPELGLFGDGWEIFTGNFQGSSEEDPVPMRKQIPGDFLLII